jgi:crossover junction endodeoxyribonuclease RuvC
MRIFGIDPGSSKLGIGVVDLRGARATHVAHAVIRAGGRRSFAERLLTIHDRLQEALQRHQPEVVVIEEVFFGRNARTAIKIGECRGAALLAAARSGAEIVEYAARDVKKAVVGTGAAGKEQVKWMIAREFGLDREDLAEDAADALALCLTHAQRTVTHVPGR